MDGTNRRRTDCVIAYHVHDSNAEIPAIQGGPGFTGTAGAVFTGSPECRCWLRCAGPLAFDPGPRTIDGMSTATSIADASSADSCTSPSLLDRVAQRDPEAWQRLVRLYGPLIFHWARRQGLGEHDAADILQDVFASVSRSIHRFEHRRAGAFRSWLWTITRNHVVTCFRTRADEAPAAGGTQAWRELANVAATLSDDPDEFTDRQELTALHQRGLEIVRSEFEERTWQIFWRVTVDELTTAEVAAEFGVTPNSVRQYKSRVLRRLRQILGD